MKGVLIIAEAGVNHNGDLSLAYKLIDEAFNAGADIVKFQTFKAEKLASRKAAKAEYQIATTGKTESQFDMLKKLELSEDDHDNLMAYCRKKGIEFLSTPFDQESSKLLKAKGITIGKIPSGEITNLPYLQDMAKNFPRIILSTGMCEMDEVKMAVKVLLDAGASKKNITILHCNTEYPTPMADVNLKAMNHIKNELDIEVGYSDHTLGIEVPVAAVALGATVIEKHFTLDRNMEGPDHKASLEPDDLKAMVSAIRNIEKALSGSGIKEPSASEIKNRDIARKSLVASKYLASGSVVTENDIEIKRPGNGISPMRIHEFIGKKLKRSIEQDEIFTIDHFE